MNPMFNNFLLINIQQKSETNQLVYGFLRFIYFLVIFMLILIAAYLFSKYIAKKSFVKSNDKNIKLIESISLGADKKLFLIDVAGNFFLISSTQKEINLISQINPESLILNKNEKTGISNNEEFNDYVDEINLKYTSSSYSNNADNVKESIKKLKTMFRGNK